MDSPSLAALHTVEFLGFYLPPLLLWSALAVIPFFILRWLLDRSGFYDLVWRRSLFNLALYMLSVGGTVFVANLVGS